MHWQAAPELRARHLLDALQHEPWLQRVDPALDFLIAARRSEIRALEQLRATSDLVRGMSEWVHRLQRERGASNMFLASRGQRFASERQQSVDDSRSVEAAVRQRHFQPGADPGATYGGMRLLSRIAQMLHEVDSLPQLRQRIAQRVLTPEQATRCYSERIAAMLAVVFEAADTAADPGVSRSLVALFNFMQGKELAGQERAAGAAAFAAAQFDAPVQQRLAHLVEAQERCFQIFQEFAEPELQAIWARLQAGSETGDVAALRQVLREGGAARAAGDAAERWFALATRRIDAMRSVEDGATSALVVLCEARLAQARCELPGLGTAQPEGGEPAAALAPMAVLFAPGPGLLVAEGLGPQLGRSMLDLVQAQAQRLQSMGDELLAAQTALRERKLVERAKGLLMDRRGLSEEAAYKLLRQTAMQQNRRLGEVAESVLQMGPLIAGL
jgi:hypothetical protein